METNVGRILYCIGMIIAILSLLAMLRYPIWPFLVAGLTGCVVATVGVSI